MYFAEALDFLKMSVRERQPPSIDAIQTIIRKARINGLSVEEIAELAIVYASSGEQLSLSQNKNIIADIASTGGPSSLSTLLCPLYLVLMGANVPKLGVPGRPAGGIDVLAQVQGYKTHLTDSEISSVINRCGYAHFNAGIYAPLDAEIFSYRQKTDAQNIPDLVIASLLSKKLCVGIDRIGLDIRVSSFGNFGSNFDEARQNAYKFCDVAKFLGKEAVCFLTNGAIPYQPYIGRSEALYALNNIFSANLDKMLSEHDQLCFTMANQLLGPSNSYKPEFGSLQKVFIENIECQNGRLESYYEAIKSVHEAHIHEILSEDEGLLIIDLHLIRSILVDAQKKSSLKKSKFPDPCGVILKSEAGKRVKKGEILATFRCNQNEDRSLAAKFEKAFKISETIDSDKSRFEVIKGV